MANKLTTNIFASSFGFLMTVVRFFLSNAKAVPKNNQQAQSSRISINHIGST